MGGGLLPPVQMPMAACGVIFGKMNIFQVLKSRSLYFNSQNHCWLLGEHSNTLKSVSGPLLSPLSSHVSVLILPLHSILPLATHIPQCAGRASADSPAGMEDASERGRAKREHSQKPPIELLNECLWIAYHKLQAPGALGEEQDIHTVLTRIRFWV